MIDLRHAVRILAKSPGFAVVAEAGRQATAEQRALAATRDAAMRAKLEQHGVEVVDLSPDELDAFRQRVRPLYAEAAQTLSLDEVVSVES